MVGNFKKTVMEDKLPVRVLAYGEDKTRKTTWAGMPSTSGWNILYLDTDAGANVLGTVLDEKAQDRIVYVNIRDDFNKPVAAQFISRLMKGDDFFWDLKNRQCVAVTIGQVKRPVESDMLLVRPRAMTTSDLLVIDSYTQLCNSYRLTYMSENGKVIDNSKQEWVGYQWENIIATHFLSTLQSFDASVIVVGHAKKYEVMDKDTKSVLSSKIYPSSVSGPHSVQVGKYFTDLLYFRAYPSGVRINTRNSDSEACGSKSVPPNLYAWQDLQFSDIAKANHLEPCETTRGWQYLPSDLSDDQFAELSGFKVAVAVVKAPVATATATATVPAVGASKPVVSFATAMNKVK